MQKVAFGGGCHWCAEAIFQSVKGVSKVEQGWVRSVPPYESFSEAVIVHYNESDVERTTLIEVHLLTHSSTSDHSMREKYRSAIYFFEESDEITANRSVKLLGTENRKNYITKVLPFVEFKMNDEQFLDYYQKNREKPFCKTYIIPKFKKLRKNFPEMVKDESSTY